MNVLHVCANPKPVNESTSKQLAVAFFCALAEKCPDVEVTNIDLYENPPPFINLDSYKCFWYPIIIDGYKATDKEKSATPYSYEQAELVKNADVLVLTMPLWNNSVPAIMKAWLEHVLQPSLLWEPDGKGGVRVMHHLKEVVLLVASGETLTSESDAQDALSPVIRAAFGHIGVTNIVTAWADGQAAWMYKDSEERKRFAKEAAEELAEEIAQL